MAGFDGHTPAQAGQFARRWQHRRQRGFMHQHDCSTVFQHVLQAGGLFPNAHRHGDGAESRSRKQTHHKLHTVTQQQRDPVSGLNAQTFPTRRQLADPLVQLRISQARVFADQGLSLRSAGQGIGQQRMQTAWTLGKATQCSGRLEMRFRLLRRPMHLEGGHSLKEGKKKRSKGSDEIRRTQRLSGVEAQADGVWVAGNSGGKW